MSLIVPINHNANIFGETWSMSIAEGGGMGSFDAIRRMIDMHALVYGSDEIITMTDYRRNSHLHYALKNITKVTAAQAREKGQIARYLIERGADPLLANRRGERPVDYVGPVFGAMFNLPVPPAKRAHYDWRATLNF